MLIALRLSGWTWRSYRQGPAKQPARSRFCAGVPLVSTPTDRRAHTNQSAYTPLSYRQPVLIEDSIALLDVSRSPAEAHCFEAPSLQGYPFSAPRRTKRLMSSS
jgi:hypothetical protein